MRTKRRNSGNCRLIRPSALTAALFIACAVLFAPDFAQGLHNDPCPRYMDGKVYTKFLSEAIETYDKKAIDKAIDVCEEDPNKIYKFTDDKTGQKYTLVNFISTIHDLFQRGMVDSKMIDIIKHVIKKGGDPSLRSGIHRHNLLHIATIYDSLELTRFLLHNTDIDVLAPDAKGGIPFGYACYVTKDPRMIDLFLNYQHEYAQNIGLGDDSGGTSVETPTCLHLAVYAANIVSFEAIIDKTSYVDITVNGDTPLSLAFEGLNRLNPSDPKVQIYSDMINQLLAHGADISMVDPNLINSVDPSVIPADVGVDSEAALVQAVLSHDRQAIDKALENIDVNAVITDAQGVEFRILEALFTNAREDSEAISTMRYLINEKGANPNLVSDEEKRNLLHLAVIEERSDMMEFLLQDVRMKTNTKDSQGLSPLHLACISSQDPETVDLLLKAGADMNSKTGDGSSCLHLAAQENNRAVIQNITQYRKLDIDAKNADGQSALDLALMQSQGESSDIVSILTDAGAKTSNQENARQGEEAQQEGEQVQQGQVQQGQGEEAQQEGEQVQQGQVQQEEETQQWQ